MRQGMKVFTLIRIIEHKEHGTFGVLIDKDLGLPTCVTVERVYRNNEPNVSCIPPGEYICRRYSSVTHPDCFEVTNVIGRTAILIHKGNLDDHSSGCIILGELFDPVKRADGSWDYGVLSSGAAFGQFMRSLEGQDEFKLVIEVV